MTPEDFCQQGTPRTLPARLCRPDPWLIGGGLLFTAIVLWVTFKFLEDEYTQLMGMAAYALLAWVVYIIGRRGRLRFVHLLQYGVAIKGVISEQGAMLRELPKSTVTFYFVEITFPGGELEPVKQTVPQASWHQLTESTVVNVLYDPSGKNGYVLVDILALD